MTARILTFILGLLAAPAQPTPAAPRETVVLLHGLNRTHRSMAKLAGSLKADGYEVINCAYPSRETDIDALAEDLFATLTPRIRSAPKVHFVTHSLGGLLLRSHLQRHSLQNLGRVVMLAPPNRGSEVAERLRGWRLYRWLNGPSGSQLGIGRDSYPRKLGPPAFDLGVIAGDRSVNPLLSLLIPGPDDGKVSVERTKTAGMRDFLRLHVTHTFMMRNRHVIRQTRHFLFHGRFASRAERVGPLRQKPGPSPAPEQWGAGSAARRQNWTHAQYSA